jgi:hypothetical protein
MVSGRNREENYDLRATCGFEASSPAVNDSSQYASILEDKSRPGSIYDARRFTNGTGSRPSDISTT